VRRARRKQRARRGIGRSPLCPPRPPSRDRLGSRAAAMAQASLRIDRDARWFRAARRRAHLARQEAIAAAPAPRARRRAPSISGPRARREALLAVGWPGERVLTAGAHRVQVAIATLRRLGLRTHLASRDDGYLLDPCVPIELVADNVEIFDSSGARGSHSSPMKRFIPASSAPSPPSRSPPGARATSSQPPCRRPPRSPRRRRTAPRSASFVRRSWRRR
jgi:hypothetical protein